MTLRVVPTPSNACCKCCNTHTATTKPAEIDPKLADAATPVKADTPSADSGWMHTAAEGGKKATEWATKNPGKAVVMGAGVILAAAPMAAAAPVLGAFGFGANGIIAGSVAAGAQSSIGSVVAPSLFATLQSAAAGGYGVAAVSTAVQGVGGLVASSAGMLGFLQRGNKKKGEIPAGDGEEKDAQTKNAEGDKDVSAKSAEEEKEPHSDAEDDDSGNVLIYDADLEKKRPKKGEDITIEDGGVPSKL
ncbi:hypothetical protein GGS21DRAFT_461225 [Xylaria nigripes]|nr:hypothetical protein GGS21DRAFT_461225 [Xylaria nigripes]